MRRALLIALLSALVPTAASAADEAPGWLAEIATRQAPDYGDIVPAAVLFAEEKATVSPDGSVTTSVRKAIRVLSRKGRPEAAANVVYYADSDKVKHFEAWTVYPSGQVKRHGKKEIADLSLADNDVYNEVRAKRISGAADADIGAVFGYESVVVERSIFTQFSYSFQDDLPALTSRFVLELPAGWTAKSVAFNHDSIEPEIDGSRYVWQLDHLPPIVDEAASPRLSSLAPRIGVSYFAPAGMETEAGPTFESWEQVSQWLATLSDPHALPDEAVRAKALELAAGASSPLERIAAIARFAQSINYVSIQIGVGGGGGYEPHSAAETLAHGYGDCKDKANLMRAMLAAVNIDSYAVTVDARDPYYVDPDWPSPRQFNHAIIAVAAPQDYDGPAAVEQERYGKLLIFDPTDSYTPPGELRESLQGGHGLLVDARGGALIELPSTRPDANLVRRNLELELAADGTIAGRLAESSIGEAAARERRTRESLSRADYRRYLELWLTNQAQSAVLGEFAAAESKGGESDLELDFEAVRYGRTMGTKLLIFRPAVVSRRGLHYPIDDDRRYPVVLRSQAFDETVRVRLPDGFVVDEMPPPLELDTSVGLYRAKIELEAGALLFTRRLEIESARIPPEQYAEVRKFFGLIAGLEQSPVVLVRR